MRGGGQGKDSHLETRFELVEQDLRRNWKKFTFCDTIEKIYNEERADQMVKHHVLSCLAGLTVFNLFVMIDMWMVPDIIWRSAFIHFCVATPLCLTIIRQLAKKENKSKILLLNILMSVAIATILFVIFASASSRAWLYVFTLPLVMLFSNIVIPMPLVSAIWFSVITCLCVAITAWLHPQIDLANGAFATLVVSGMAFYTLIATYRIETSGRRAYLLALRERLRSEMLADRNEKLRTLSDLDGLTGIGNRRHFDASLDDVWRACEREELPVSLLMIDIDHFKRLNDTHGHLGGDECLRVVADLLTQETRGRGDIPFRYGGEEFSVLLSTVDDITHAEAVADRIRERIQNTPITIDPRRSKTVHITVSIGHATMIPGAETSAAHLISSADAALYLAKKSGRNCVRSEILSHPVHASVA